MGRIAWLDLTVSAAAATCDFYRQVVGWLVQNVELEDGGEHYAEFGADAQEMNDFLQYHQLEPVFA